MSKFLDSLAAKEDQFYTLYIPEWSPTDEPLCVKYTAITPANQAQAARLAGDQSSPEYQYRYGVALICLKLRNEDGEPLFSDKEIGRAMKVLDADVAARVLNQMRVKYTLEEAKKD